MTTLAPAQADALMDRIMSAVTERFPGFEVAELTADGLGDIPKAMGLTYRGEIVPLFNDGATAWTALRAMVLTAHNRDGEGEATKFALRLIAAYILADRPRRDPRAVNAALKVLHEPATRASR